MLRLYQLLVPILFFILQALSLVVPSLEEFLDARRNLLERWRKQKFHRPIWIHVSSVGELEQIRPAIDAMKGQEIVLSYYSTSLPRLMKDWSFVHYSDYLPLDFPDQMQELMEIINPKILVLNRYDIWPNHLEAAKKKGIPVILVNASTPPIGLMGRISLWIRARLFQQISAWTFVDSAAAAAWEPYVKNHARGYVTGNPRVDRALQRVELALAQKRIEKIQNWKRRKFCLVAGSTWEEDEKLLLRTWKFLKEKDYSLILVPHEPTEEHLIKLEKNLQKSELSFIRMSALQESDADVLVVDQRGYLAEIYGLGNIAYVGGGFGKQIHSIIEPVAHGLPVAFGPHYHRSPEAITLLAAGAAKSEQDPRKLAAWIELICSEKEETHRVKEAIRVFLQIHRGAGQRVADFLLL